MVKNKTPSFLSPTKSVGSATSASLLDRQLVRPSAHIPWSVDVVSAVPKALIDTLKDVGGGRGNESSAISAMSKATNDNSVGKNAVVVAGATCPGWACLALSDGYIHVWQPKTIPLSEQYLEPPKNSNRFLFIDLICDDDDIVNDYDDGNDNNNENSMDGADGSGGKQPRRRRRQKKEVEKPLLAISGDLDSVNIYAYYKGWLLLKKATRRDLSSRIQKPLSKPHTAKTRVVIEDGDNDGGNNDGDDDADRIVSLVVDFDVIMLASRKGNLFWVTHTSIPVGLHVQKVETSSGSWSSMFFGGRSSSRTLDAENPSLHHVLPLQRPPQHLLRRTPSRNNKNESTFSAEFISISSMSGEIIHWTVNSKVASSHLVSFEPSSKGKLSFLDVVDSQQIIRATMAADQRSIHCIVRGEIHEDADDETRLYWIEVGLDGTIRQSHWLSRFALPDEVKVAGLTVAENGNAYASFETPDVVIIMVVSEGIVQEVDLPATQIPSLLPNLFSKDVVTHGCSMVATSGIGLRVRYMVQNVSAGSAVKRPRTDAGMIVSNPSLLISHLRSSFWQCYQDPDVQRPMPPSLRQAPIADLEAAVIAFCTELQHKGDTSSAQNPMEWHKSFCRMLQEGGLYRSLSQQVRWKLLSIGQELVVFGYLARFNKVPEWQAKLKAYDVVMWFQQVQEDQQTNNGGGGSWEESTVWNQLFSMSLDAAATYREENATTFYDVTSSTPPEPIWLNDPTMQSVLLRQLNGWKSNGSKGAELSQIEAVVKAALRSFAESDAVKAVYAEVKELAINLLRSVNNGDDEVAFELCIQYQYFQGLCQIAVDHEKKRDAPSYSLDPLFTTITGSDLLSGLSFSRFVLKWHTNAGLFGHVINYGRHCPIDLAHFMKEDERLRKYRWIPAIRQGYYEQATEACLENCQDDKTLGGTQWSLSFAKLANKLVVSQNKKRIEFIETKLDMVCAQRMLMEIENETINKNSQDNNSKKFLDEKMMIHKIRTEPLWDMEEIVTVVLKLLRTVETLDDQIKLAMIGLTVCAAVSGEDRRRGRSSNRSRDTSERMGSSTSSMAMEYTAKIWAETLRLDATKWQEWISTSTDLTDVNLCHTILHSTVFGALLQECQEDNEMSPVTYGKHIEGAVINKVTTTASSQQSGASSSSSSSSFAPYVDVNKRQFSRLLRSVSISNNNNNTHHHTISGQSLVVASY